MRIIKGALISFSLIFLLLTAMSLLMPSRVRISRAADIRMQHDSLQAYLATLRNWTCWMPALRGDSTPVNFAAQSSGAGAALRTPTATIRINNATPGSITFTILQNGDSLTGGFTIIPGRSADSTVLQWYFDQRFKWYPWQKFKSLFSEKILGPEMEAGMEGIKRCTELK
jgi:hypothetical protein